MPRNRQAAAVMSGLKRPGNGKLAALTLLAASCLGACSNLGDLTVVGVKAEDSDAQKAHNELRVIVEYTSSKNLSQFDKYELRGEFFLCGRPDAHLRMGPLEMEFDQPPYRAVFRTALVEAGPSDPPFESFDLWQRPQDVCFRLKQGPYAEIGPWSRVLVIPKEKIASAISGAELAIK